MMNLSDEEKAKIAKMAGPKEMEPTERKRQYSALRRAIRGSASAALTTKFELCSDNERRGIWVPQLQTSNSSRTVGFQSKSIMSNYSKAISIEHPFPMIKF